MKKVMYICLALIVFGGLGAGFWFLKSGNKTDNPQPVADESSRTYMTQTVSALYKTLVSTKHIAEYDTQVAALTKLETSPNVVLFAPTKKAVDTFVTETSLGLVKFLPYHVVASDAPIEVTDGKKLKTEDGQEVIIVKIANDLYVRDAKGNDVRLRKPIEAKNGKIYIIDKVLLTQ
jgi:uncharacterized surface protein with fasciclin (FAS1) repeats